MNFWEVLLWIFSLVWLAIVILCAVSIRYNALENKEKVEELENKLHEQRKLNSKKIREELSKGKGGKK